MSEPRRSTRIFIQSSIPPTTAEPVLTKEVASKRAPAKPKRTAKPPAAKARASPAPGPKPKRVRKPPPLKLPVIKGELPTQAKSLHASHKEMIQQWFTPHEPEPPLTKESRRKKFSEPRYVKEERAARLINDGSDGKPMLAYEGMYGPAPKPCGPLVEWMDKCILKELVHGILQVVGEQPPLPLYRLGEIFMEKAKHFEAITSFPTRPEEAKELKEEMQTTAKSKE